MQTAPSRLELFKHFRTFEQSPNSSRVVTPHLKEVSCENMLYDLQILDGLWGDGGFGHGNNVEDADWSTAVKSVNAKPGFVLL